MGHPDGANNRSQCEVLSFAVSISQYRRLQPGARYPDEAGLEAHQATEHYKAAIKKGGEEGLLAGPMTVMKLKALDGGFDTR